MSSVYGVLGVDDTQADFLINQGQEVVFDAINEVLAEHNEDVAQAASIFVKGETEKFQQRWLNPGSGELSPLGQDPMAPGPAVRGYGEWDVAYPLREYGESLSTTRAGLAYMTYGELNAHLDTIMWRDKSQHRIRIMTALMEDTNFTFGDIKHGSLTIRRLANGAGDSVVYPLVPGEAAEATDLHYFDAAYNVAGIAVGTNPVEDLRDEILEHFDGRNSFGDEVLYICGSDQTPYLTTAAMIADGFVPIGDMHVDYGDDTDLSQFLAGVPGRVLGRGWGCWITEWPYMPDEYGLAVYLPKPPLMRRVDIAASGLPRGLSLVAVDRDHPLQSAHYSDRFGYGVGNRLSAACIEINAGGATYTPPASYAE